MVISTIICENFVLKIFRLTQNDKIFYYCIIIVANMACINMNENTATWEI